MEESKRWIVTYTKHLRQKRKVYQDGIIELHRPSNKVLLYDDSSKLLDSRLLRKDELIESGATLSFETHIVDIGEPEETHHPLQDMHADGSHGKSKVKVENVQKFKGSFLVKKNHRDIGRSSICANDVRVQDREWDVLYTAQVTQKAKRYHDGVLRRVTCGSHMAQLILLKEDGSTLSNKFQKLSECLIVGNKYEMPNYLVEICAQRNVLEALDAVEKNCESQRRIQNKNPSNALSVSMKGDVNIDSRFIIQKNNPPKAKRVPIKVSPKPESHPGDRQQDLSSSLKISLTGLGVSEDKISGTPDLRSSGENRLAKAEVLTNKPRDASQILSVLKRPSSESVAIDKPCSSQSLDSFHFSSQHSDMTKLLYPNCEGETQRGSGSCLSTISCEEDSCKTPVPDCEIKCTEQDSLDLETSQPSAMTQRAENGSSWTIPTEGSLGSPPEGRPEPGSGLLNGEAGLHGDILPFPEREENRNKILSGEEEQEGAPPSASPNPLAPETSGSFPSFDLGFEV